MIQIAGTAASFARVAAALEENDSPLASTASELKSDAPLVTYKLVQAGLNPQPLPPKDGDPRFTPRAHAILQPGDPCLPSAFDLRSVRAAERLHDLVAIPGDPCIPTANEHLLQTSRTKVSVVSNVLASRALNPQPLPPCDPLHEVAKAALARRG